MRSIRATSLLVTGSWLILTRLHSATSSSPPPAAFTTGRWNRRDDEAIITGTTKRRHPCLSSPAALITSLLFAASSEVPTRPSSSGERDVTAPSSTSSSSSSPLQSPLQGARDFEGWFGKIPGASCGDEISHASFGSLRGLEWKRPREELISKGVVVATVPDKIVLQSDFKSPNWDADLACKLWDEYRRGDDSNISGYVRLLTTLTSNAEDENGDVPCSTAPNALRHWTKEQRDALSTSAAGRKLLGLNREQEEKWMSKYDSYAASKNICSWQQFRWAMEVVHSRAFCGVSSRSDDDQGGGGSSSIAKSLLANALVPVAAAAAGWWYTFSSPGNLEQSNTVLAVLALVASAPLLANVVGATAGTGPSSAVLLPLIDSANHMESADSKIEYDPLSRRFQLSVGPSCLVPDTDADDNDKTQLFISYGSKSDAELLLNYGFLPTVTCSEGNDDDARNEQRRLLAEEFQRRSS